MSQPPPALSFRVDGMPPRKTLQSGRGAYREADGSIRFFTKAGVRAEAWEMRAEFARGLPAGWRAREGAVRVQVELVYPLRKPERERLVAAGTPEVLLPHVERPDADNLVKSLLDSMTRAGVWVDDAQVCDLRVRKWRGIRPRWAVFVWFLPATPLPKVPRGRKQGTPAAGQGVLFAGDADCGRGEAQEAGGRGEDGESDGRDGGRASEGRRSGLTGAGAMP